VIVVVVAAAVVWASNGSSSNHQNDATIAKLQARLATDEKALKTIKGTQVNQLCSILQLHDEVDLLITEVDALQAGKPAPQPKPHTAC
jgi:uncharacterized coiled-coil protein SlyX